MPKASTSPTIEHQQAATKTFLESLKSLMQRQIILLEEWETVLHGAPPHSLWWSDLCSWVEKHPPEFAPALTNKSPEKLIQRGWAWLEGGHVVAKRKSECAKIQLPPDRLEMVLFHTGHRWEPDGYLGFIAGRLLGLPAGDSMEEHTTTESIQARLVKRIAYMRQEAEKVSLTDPFTEALNREFARQGICLDRTGKTNWEKAEAAFLKVSQEHGDSSSKAHRIAEKLVESCRTIEDALRSDQPQPVEWLWALGAALEAGKLYERLKLESDENLTGTNVHGAVMKNQGQWLSRLIEDALLSLRDEGVAKPTAAKVRNRVGATDAPRPPNQKRTELQINNQIVSIASFTNTLKNVKLTASLQTDNKLGNCIYPMLKRCL